MDPRINPYAPGAGTPPPELAGRDAVLADARLAIQRNKSGRSARSFMFVISGLWSPPRRNAP